jgi:probable F420-dependent oxidoreductase
VTEAAVRHEAGGYDGIWTSESKHDPFLPLVVAAEHTRRLEIGTAIAVAFARSPMTVAYAAHDLQAYSGRRFTLGLGTQVKPHIERRFSMPWSRPAARMREYIAALHAIWASWNEGSALDFQGDFYRHT